MKRKGLLLLAFAALAALVAPQRAQAQWDYISSANWDGVFDDMLHKYTEVTDILCQDSKKNSWKCENIIVIGQYKHPNRGNDPKTHGGLIQRDGTRRFPKTDKGPENISQLRGKKDSKHPIVEFDPDAAHPVAFIVFRDVEWYKPNAQLRLFLLRGRMTINEDKDGNVTGFTLQRAAFLREDKNFKANAAYDEVMSMYACVQEDPEWRKMDIKGIRAKHKNDGNKAADEVINKWTGLAGALGALGGAAPLWALPAEFAQNFVENVNKARLAWAVAQCYGRQREFDDFKNDLYILFADDDVGVTLRKIAKETGVAAAKDISAEAITNEQVLTALALKLDKAGGKAAARKAVAGAIKTTKTAEAVEKQAVKGAKGAGTAIAFATIIIKGSMSANDAKKFGAKAKQFYRD
jgi:hypothetical protein